MVYTWLFPYLGFGLALAHHTSPAVGISLWRDGEKTPPYTHTPEFTASSTFPGHPDSSLHTSVYSAAHPAQCTNRVKEISSNKTLI